jgi:hypothetical protein
MHAGIVVVIVVASLTSLAAAEEASISVTPRVAMEGSTVVITVRITPDPSLRALVLEADSPEFFRSSFLQLEGARSAAVHTLELRSLPAGRYYVRVVIDRAEGESYPDDAMLLARFRILG